MISDNNLVIMLVTGLCLVVIAAGIHTKYIYDTHQDIDETQESWESKSLTNTGRIRLGVTWLVVLLLLLGMVSLYYVFRKVEGEVVCYDAYKNEVNCDSLLLYNKGVKKKTDVYDEWEPVYYE